MAHLAEVPPTPDMRAQHGRRAGAIVVIGGDRRARSWPDRPAAKPVVTRRQLTILAMKVEGALTQDIAAGLVISRATARNHLAHILRRLNVRSRAHAVARAHELGLLP